MRASGAQDKGRFAEWIDEARQFVEIGNMHIDEVDEEISSVKAVRVIRTARVLCYQHQYEGAVPFFSKALRQNPTQAPVDYHDAACAALLAAQELGHRHNPPDNSAAHHRQLALKWLTEELRLWQQKVQSGEQTEVNAARRVMGQWRIDPDLQFVRGEEAIQALPPDEREPWDHFWQSVRRFASQLRPR